MNAKPKRRRKVWNWASFLVGVAVGETLTLLVLALLKGGRGIKDVEED